jgi:Acyltransferase family
MQLLRFERIDSDVLLRAIGISMVVYHHVVLYHGYDSHKALFGFSLVGGMGMLLMLSGFSFARFGLHNRDRTNAMAATLSTAKSIILPCYVAMVFFSIVAFTFNPAELLMIGNFIDGDWQAGFNTWYPQFLLQVFLIVLVIYGLRPVGDWLARHPALGALSLLAVALAVHVGLKTWAAPAFTGQHLPWMLIWNFFLGWAIFNLVSRDSVVPQKRLIASLVSFTAIALTLEITETRAWTTTVAAMMVIWIPRLRLPKILSRVAFVLSQAALTIFILHMSLIKIFKFAFGRLDSILLLEAVTVVILLGGLWVLGSACVRAYYQVKHEYQAGGLVWTGLRALPGQISWRARMATIGLRPIGGQA